MRSGDIYTTNGRIRDPGLKGYHWAKVAATNQNPDIMIGAYLLEFRDKWTFTSYGPDRRQYALPLRWLNMHVFRQRREKPYA